MSTISKGQVGEDRAARVLRDAGMRIIERNYRCRLGELDAVARDGNTLVFVEVRTRGRADRGDALASVGFPKQRQLARVAAHYLHVRKPDAPYTRFDVIGITAGVVTHVRDAFRLGSLR